MVKNKNKLNKTNSSGWLDNYSEEFLFNENMKKKLKKYPAGGYLTFQEGYKGFGMGPDLYQDNSYFRSVMPDNIENMEAEINKPSIFSGINNVLGGIDQVASKGIGLVDDFLKSKTNNALSNLNLMENPEQAFMQNYQSSPVKKIDINDPSNLTDFEDFDMSNLWSDYFKGSNNLMGPQLPKTDLGFKGVPFINKYGGYLSKYQNGGMTDTMPLGGPEYIHPSNVFREHVIPVPKVHFTEDTSNFDMGVNLNDLIQMNGGKINKYYGGGFAGLYGNSYGSVYGQPRVFNSNTNRATASELQAATANDFLHTKMRSDRQSFEDDKISWGVFDFLKEPTGAVLGTLSAVPVLGDTVKDVLGDSFLTRTGGYQVGKGIGKTALGVTKIATGITNPTNILSGIGDIGEGVGSTVGNLNAKSAMRGYDKQGYVSGKRLANAAQDFNTTMGLSSKLYGTAKSIVDLAKNPGAGSLNSFLNNKNPYNPKNKDKNDLNFLFNNLMPNFGGSGSFSFLGQNGGYIDYYQNGGNINYNNKQTGWLDQL